MESNEQREGVRSLNQVVQIDEGRIAAHVDEVVRSTVEETLNGLLDAEADRLCGAQRYERNEARRDTRAGSYQRQLQTKAGEVSLRVPKLRSLPFETAIIERYKRRESSVEEALKVMYLALRNLARKWNSVQGWKDALNRFGILWEARFPQNTL